jgi:hypothetical protein
MAQVSRARLSRRFYGQLAHSSRHGFLDPLDFFNYFIPRTSTECNACV